MDKVELSQQPLLGIITVTDIFQEPPGGIEKGEQFIISREAWRYALCVAEKLSQAPKGSLARERLSRFRETWKYAQENSAYYHRILPEINLEQEQLNLKHLYEIPILTKTELIEHSDEFRCSKGLPDYMVFTGGTTGLPKIIYGSSKNLSQKPNAAKKNSAQKHPLALVTDGGHHGTVPQVPGYMGYIQVPLRNRKNYEWVWRILTAEHNFEGFETKISYARLPLPAVKKLVHFILEQDYDRSSLSLQVVGTFAWYLSTTWRRLIEDTLGAVVIDYFGFTETFSGLARECPVCGWYHYGKQVIWEVVDVWNDQPINEGIGKLLVTSLFPYNRDQILFRYESGDLVEVGPFCNCADDRGFKFRGRLSQSFAISDGQKWNWALFPTQVQEIIDSNHWIARFEETRFSGITASGDDAFPKWRIQQVKARIPILQIELEMKSSTFLFHREWKLLEEEVLTNLMNANSDLKRLVQDNKVILQIKGLPPGSLKDHEVFIC